MYNLWRGEGDRKMSDFEPQLTITVRSKDFGFTKTLPFTKEGIEKLRKLIEFLETQLGVEE